MSSRLLNLAWSVCLPKRIWLTLALVIVIVSPRHAVAQNAAAIFEDDAFANCLHKKFPHVQRHQSTHASAFDPDSGRNFAYDKDKETWTDVKTGEVICPKLSPSRKNTLWEDAVFANCLHKKFPHVQRHSSTHASAFDPDSGRNFGWDKDKQAWIDTKTGKCICPECPGQTAENVLKTIGRSIHVDIGIGGGYTSGHDEHHHGEDRHRTAEKVSTDKTKTHTTSPTTMHKTVTSACKCHPCTCSPCHCH